MPGNTRELKQAMSGEYVKAYSRQVPHIPEHTMTQTEGGMAGNPQLIAPVIWTAGGVAITMGKVPSVACHFPKKTEFPKNSNCGNIEMLSGAIEAQWK